MSPTTLRTAEGIPKMQHLVDTARRKLRVDQKAADGVDVQADLQGSVEYKSHLCRVFAKRALEAAVKRAQG